MEVTSHLNINDTNKGITGLVGELTAVLQENIDSGLLASFKIVPPLAEDADPIDKANGIIVIPFDAVLAGEISQITIRGFLSV